MTLIGYKCDMIYITGLYFWSSFHVDQISHQQILKGLSVDGLRVILEGFCDLIIREYPSGGSF